MINSFDGYRSSGAGQIICVGITGQPHANRGLFRFDVSSIPLGSVVTAVSLDLVVAPNAMGSAANIDAHLLLEDWGEAGSVSPGAGGCEPGPGGVR